MPFISEELYQKLPDFSGKCESICIAPYPKVNGWKIDIEKTNFEFDLLYGLVKTIRSMGASVNLPNNAKPVAYLLILKSATNISQIESVYLQNQEVITTLSKSGKLVFIKSKDEVPKGCIADVSCNCTEVHLSVKDYIDIPKEIERLEKKIAANNGLIDGLQKKMGVSDYETKVPEKVRKENKEKLEGYQTDNTKLSESLTSFKKMI